MLCETLTGPGSAVLRGQFRERLGLYVPRVTYLATYSFIAGYTKLEFRSFLDPDRCPVMDQ